MPPPVSISIVVPAYNEAARIVGTIDAMQAHLERRQAPYEILVVADGDDGTRERVAARAGDDTRIRVFGGRERRGKGRGVRLGVEQATGHVIGFVDADYKTPIEEMDKLVPWLDRGFDLAIGSRALPDSTIVVRQPRYRQIGSRVFAFGMHAIVGLRDVSDTQCGFKFFRGEVARDLFARQRIDGYMFDVEILHLAKRAGYRLKEVGVVWQDDNDSRLDLVAGNWRNLKDLLRIRFTRAAQRSSAAAQRGAPSS